jgi:hypothetical protein
MSDIKAGDLVMVVRGCPICGDLDGIGMVFKVSAIELSKSITSCCAKNTFTSDALQDGEENCWWPVSALKKIDPPVEGDSLPTRANLDQSVTA